MTPRPKVERVARSIRLRKDADDELVRRAEAAGLSVNAYLESLIADDDTYFQTSRAMWREKALTAQTNCPHPRKSRQVFSWGSKCGDCGSRLGAPPSRMT